MRTRNQQRNTPLPYMTLINKLRELFDIILPRRRGGDGGRRLDEPDVEEEVFMMFPPTATRKTTVVFDDGPLRTWRLQDIRGRARRLRSKRYMMRDYRNNSQELADRLLIPRDVEWLLEEVERLEKEKGDSSDG